MPPTWSVMIPAYRCNDFLPQCLESVLSQDPGPARMQIAVVNDDPGDGGCAEVVRRFPGGRIDYHHNPRNLGAGGNFNRCLALAQNELVLVLHGDCYVKENYFARLSDLAQANPAAGMLACRADGVDVHGAVIWESLRYPPFESLTRDDSAIWESLHLMPSAVVVRRDVYRRVGGFREDIANGQDWEMWSRIIRAAGIVMTPEVLAAYRQHADSITGRTRRSAQNIRELAQLYALFATEIPDYPHEKMRRALGVMALGQALEFQRLGDIEGTAANFRQWRELTPLPARVMTRLKLGAKTWLGRPAR